MPWRFGVHLEGGAARLWRNTLVGRSLGRRGLLALATSGAVATALAPAARAAVPAHRYWANELQFAISDANLDGIWALPRTAGAWPRASCPPASS
jgi:hypothetical protein